MEISIEEVLKGFTGRELNALLSITLEDIKKEIESRKIKRYNVGDCLKLLSYHSVVLIRIEEVEEGVDYRCTELAIQHYVEMYEDVSYTNYTLEDTEPFDKELFEKICTLITTRNDSMKKIRTEFDKEIKELL